MRYVFHRSIPFFGLLMLTTVVVGSDPDDSRRFSPEQDYSGQRRSPVEYQVDFSVVVTAPHHSKVLRVWLPLPQNNACQEIQDRHLSTFPMTVAPKIGRESRFGNQFAYFEFHEPKGAQMIRHQFRAKVWEMRWNLAADNVVNVEKWPDAFAPYLQPDPLTSNAAFHAVVNKLAKPQSTDGERLYAAMSWVDTHMTYDHKNASLQADANHAFSLGRGHCSDYHGLCAAMGRELGNPTRVVYGLNLFPKDSPSHCKVESFLAPYGWVPFDVSETQKLVQSIQSHPDLPSSDKARLVAAVRRRLAQGFRENTWLLVTRGVSYELVPKASKPVRVVRTIYAEADGQPLPEPDPANTDKHEFAWMTMHDYKSDRPVTSPFKDLTSLKDFADRAR